MELLQLKYFCEAARHENFSRCAEKFLVPPSDISQTVKRLESELGTVLFERRANRVALSVQGKLFYEKVQAALGLLSDAVRELEDLSDSHRGEIRLWVCSNRRIVTEAIERFVIDYPEVSFTISHRADEDADSFDCIISDDLKLGLTHEKTSLLTERILLAHSRASRLTDAEELTAEMLAQEGFVFMDEASSLARASRGICHALGFEPRISIRTDDPYYVRKYVSMNFGIALVPEKSWAGLMGSDTVLREIGDFSRTTYAFVKKGVFVPRALTVFLEQLKSIAASDSSC